MISAEGSCDTKDRSNENSALPSPEKKSVLKYIKIEKNIFSHLIVIMFHNIPAFTVLITFER